MNRVFDYTKSGNFPNLRLHHRAVLIFLAILFYASTTQPFDFSAIQEEQHNCSMWAAISDSIPPGIVYDQLVVKPFSLKNLSRAGNMDGWGIARYNNFGDSATIYRGALAAYNDSTFDSTANRLDTSAAKIVMAHVRNCTAGCCCHECETIPNPHPFMRFKNGQYWTFEHNGGINVAALVNLIGSDYLTQNPPTGSGVLQCNPADTNLWVDSELYFLYIMKMIEQNDWNVFEGIYAAIENIIYADAYRGGINFILSDGYSIWAFRRGRTLYYSNDLNDSYSIVATHFPSTDTSGWHLLSEYDIALFQPGSAPTITNFLELFPHCAYQPGDINGDNEVTAADLTYGLGYFKGENTPPPDSCYHSLIAGDNYLYITGDVNGDCRFIGSDITRWVICYRNGSRFDYCHWTPPLSPLLSPDDPESPVEEFDQSR
jgi:predicted glutamine amidotransferase